MKLNTLRRSKLTGNSAGMLMGCCLLASTVPGLAADLYYNPNLPSGSEWTNELQWSATGFDGPFDADWADESMAHFAVSTSVMIDLGGGEIRFGSQGGIMNESTSSDVMLRIMSTIPAAMEFDGGTIHAGANNSIATTIDGKISISGNFTLSSGALSIAVSEDEAEPFKGTATVLGGVLLLHPSSVSAESHLVIAESGFAIFNDTPGDYDIGNVQVDAGYYYIGSSEGGVVKTTMRQLSSTADRGTVRTRKKSLANEEIHLLTIAQDTDTVFSGNLTGDNLGDEGNLSYFSFVKSGTGSLTLKGGTIRLPQGTVVTAGGLYIDVQPPPAVCQFGNAAGGEGADAITVSAGGSFGGNALISLASSRKLTVQQGGMLVAGGMDAAGRTVIEAPSGSVDLADAAASNRWLIFDLESDESPGGTYDQIAVRQGVLNIGDKKLGFDDFQFRAAKNIRSGVYTLFELSDGATLSGTLGEPLSGSVAEGFVGTLSLKDGNIVLKVSRGR